MWIALELLAECFLLALGFFILWQGFLQARFVRRIAENEVITIGSVR